MFFVDNKTHYKPTETFQYTHCTSCHPPGGGVGGGGVKRGFIVKKAKQEDCLEKTLKKTHLKSNSPAPGSLAGFGQPGQLVLNPSPITPGGTPRMKGVGTLVGNFELNP